MSDRDHRTAPGPGFPLPELKFRPPGTRPGIVARTALVERLAAAQVPVVTVTAPPGYGKTTLLAQWADRLGPYVAWLSCDDGDNDPVVLLSALAVALGRIGPVDPAIFPALASSGAGAAMVPRLVSAASVQPPVTVLLDQAETVTNRQCLNAIAEFALRLPPGWRFALASRTAVPLPTARLRAQGGLLEVTADDLAMGAAEADALLQGAGVKAGEGSLDDLLQRTEGWPTGLYIAALAMNSGTRQSKASFTFTGDDVFMGDYLRSELLDRISGAEVSFLTRTSVLDQMCGPLCDAILGDKGSAAVLERLEARNLLVVPLDRHREWYRYHRLFGELLRAELRRREPEAVQDLHFRAAVWFEANAMPEVAIDHAQAAGDYDRVARLILELQQPVWAGGRIETVRRWMEWIRDVTSAEYYGAIAAHGSLIFALLGQAGEAERWMAAAERASPAGILPDGSTMEGTLAYLRACLCRNGLAEMRRDAQIGWEGLSPASPYRATMLGYEGVSHLLEDDPARAAPILARALDLAAHVGAPPLTSIILAQMCTLAARRDSWSEVTALTQRAVTIVEAGHFDDYFTSAIVYAWAARAALHEGNSSQGRLYLRRASRLRPLLTYMLPVVSVQALLEMARCYITLADRAGAAAVLTQAQGILQQRPDLGLLPAQADRLEASLATIEARAAGPSALTAAELRLLPLLSTHLPVPEIAAELFLSPHTVKSEMKSIYRKLGATTRTQAVTRSRELGLLGL
ncbi:MAG TPA: LuxR C-terminal-related transcriptional regulator [Streptosporangiaceae bacterium]|nr:LuxR C-terminal-related transcriptional regulator [Streptosporangiaceae bacterium]